MKKGKVMIITFIGHSSIKASIELSNKIKEIILSSTANAPTVTFYCGGYGDFDNLCASICRELKETLNNCEIVFVTPYITLAQQKKMNHLIDSNLYDSIVYPPIENVPPRFAITKRNEWMISEANLIISYVYRTYGGTYNSLKYAQRKNKSIVNLSIHQPTK